MEDYLHDVDICQKFAERNRAKMAQIILDRCGWTALEVFQTIHNYIDVNEMVLRKGAVSTKAGEKLLVPINMRDGSLICIGKGNEDWNCSAPHGAGRLMSRSAAFEQLTMAEYEAEMAGVYTPPASFPIPLTSPPWLTRAWMRSLRTSSLPPRSFAESSPFITLRRRNNSKRMSFGHTDRNMCASAGILLV